MKKLFRIYATNSKDPDDKKRAEILEKIIESEYGKYEGIMAAIVNARITIEKAFGIHTGDALWNKILEEVIRKDIAEVDPEQVALCPKCRKKEKLAKKIMEEM